MNSRTVSTIVAALAATALPSGAFAQAMVTTTPIGLSAPLLSTTTLVLLTIALAILAGVMLRRSSAGPVAIVAILAVGVGFAVASHAVTDVVVENVECRTRFTHEYDPYYTTMNLVSNCPNPIKIVELDPRCESGGSNVGGAIFDGRAVPCVLGRILSSGDTCLLPSCTY